MDTQLILAWFLLIILPATCIILANITCYVLCFKQKTKKNSLFYITISASILCFIASLFNPILMLTSLIPSFFVVIVTANDNEGGSAGGPYD